MHALDRIRTAFSAISDRIAAVRRGSQFPCGDCERNERCCNAPDGKCIVKAAEIARDGGNNPRPPDGYFTAVWPR